MTEMSLHKKFYISIVVILGVLLYGTLGYHFLSGYRILEALYMTFITITTVGFMEVHPSTDVDKIFTMSLLLISISFLGYAVSIVTQYVVYINSSERLKNKMMKQIEKLSGHAIVCGYGRNGKQISEKLSQNKMPFVVVERNKEYILDKNILYIEGEASDNDTLVKAGVKEAKYLITALPDDADNLFVVLSARQLNKELEIVSRVRQESSTSKLLLAGANHAVMPDKIGGDYMASLLLNPDLTEFLEVFAVRGTNDDQMNIKELVIGKLSTLCDKTIAELHLRKNTGCNVIGYRDLEGKYIINPEPNTFLYPNTSIIVLGREEQIKKLDIFLKQ